MNETITESPMRHETLMYIDCDRAEKDERQRGVWNVNDIRPVPMSYFDMDYGTGSSYASIYQHCRMVVTKKSTFNGSTRIMK